jgi:hypothetical protein
MAWSLMEIAANPDVQEKIHQELRYRGWLIIDTPHVHVCHAFRSWRAVV